MKHELVGSVMVFKDCESGDTQHEGSVVVEVTDHEPKDGPSVIEIAWNTPGTKQRTYLRLPLGELVNKAMWFAGGQHE